MKTKNLFVIVLIIIAQKAIAQNLELWGMTHNYGGVYNVGVIFSYDINSNTYTKKFDFDFINGSMPWGSLMQGNDGKFYGMTHDGGANSIGVLFSYERFSGTITNLIDFDGILKGANPVGTLMQASNGKLYGVSRDGGTGTFGGLFSYDPSTATFTKHFDFSNANGTQPYCTLVESNGKLYGTTPGGGVNGYGVLFSFDITTNTYTKLFDFISGSGANPYAGLVLGNNGKLYGLTNSGGSVGGGVLYSYDPSANTFLDVHNFDGLNGFNPSAGNLIQANDNKLYGMTEYGGSSNFGVLFSFDPSSNSFYKLFDFDSTNGSYPIGSVMQASNNKLYGLANRGGSNNYGTLFEYNIATNTLLKLQDLSYLSGGRPYYTSMVELNPSLGIEEVKNNISYLSPNPTQDNFTIALANSKKKVTVRIIDITGNIIYKLSTSETQKIEISTKDFSAGVYLVQIKSDDFVETRKLIVEK